MADSRRSSQSSRAPRAPDSRSSSRAPSVAGSRTSSRAPSEAGSRPPSRDSASAPSFPSLPTRTSSSYSAPHGPRPLHRIAWEGQDVAHWALFLPNRTGDPDGLLVHIGAEKAGTSSRYRNHRLRFDTMTVTRTDAQSVFPIAQASVTETQLRNIAKDVFDRKGYSAVTNNCQHFCVDVVEELHNRYPESVPRAAVADINARGTTLTAIKNFARFFKRDRRHNPEPQGIPLQPAGSQDRISID